LQDLYLPGLKIYPNPAKDMLYINLGTTNISSPIRLTLYNQIGKQIWQSNYLSNQIEIPVKQMASGIYWLNIKDKNAIKTVKVLKE
jgi:Secretion system C-terminal sorting domain